MDAPSLDARSDPLDMPQVIFMAATEEEGDLVSFRTLAEMLRAGKLTGDSRVFVPPATKLEAKLVSDLVDMESVSDMDEDDIEELASSLMHELLPDTAVDMSGDQGRELNGTQDAVDLACAACAPPVWDTQIGCGCFRGPIELPPELAAVAERELGETPEVRTAALAELRARLESGRLKQE